MTKLLDIREQLEDTNGAIAQLEKAAAQPGATSGVSVMADSLRKRREVLETEFMAAAERLGMDVCSYRLFSDTERPKLSAVVAAMGGFQDTVVVIFDAIKNRARRFTTKVSAEAAAAVSFDFGYTFSGSVGFVLTLPNERLMFGETAVDDSLQTVFKMTKAKSSQDIQEFARTLGPAPIRAFYRWVNDQVNYGIGAEIDWRRGDQVQASILVQQPELAHLRQIIQETGEEVVESFPATGSLEGADVPGRTFHFRIDGGGDVRGKFEDAISPSHTVVLPTRYRASLRKTTRIKYSTDETEEHYFLVALEPINRP